MAETREEGLLRACENGDLELVRQLVKQGCNPRDVRDRSYLRFGATPLHNACRYVPYAPSFPPLNFMPSLEHLIHYLLQVGLVFGLTCLSNNFHLSKIYHRYNIVTSSKLHKIYPSAQLVILYIA